MADWLETMLEWILVWDWFNFEFLTKMGAVDELVLWAMAGLAWTLVGGDRLPVNEVMFTEGVVAWWLKLADCWCNCCCCWTWLAALFIDCSWFIQLEKSFLLSLVMPTVDETGLNVVVLAVRDKFVEFKLTKLSTGLPGCCLYWSCSPLDLYDSDVGIRLVVFPGSWEWFVTAADAADVGDWCFKLPTRKFRNSDLNAGDELPELDMLDVVITFWADDTTDWLDVDVGIPVGVWSVEAAAVFCCCICSASCFCCCNSSNCCWMCMFAGKLVAPTPGVPAAAAAAAAFLSLSFSLSLSLSLDFFFLSLQ